MLTGKNYIVFACGYVIKTIRPSFIPGIVCVISFKLHNNYNCFLFIDVFCILHDVRGKFLLY